MLLVACGWLADPPAAPPDPHLGVVLRPAVVGGEPLAPGMVVRVLDCCDPVRIRTPGGLVGTLSEVAVHVALLGGAPSERLDLDGDDRTEQLWFARVPGSAQARGELVVATWEDGASAPVDVGVPLRAEAKDVTADGAPEVLVVSTEPDGRRLRVLHAREGTLVEVFTGEVPLATVGEVAFASFRVSPGRIDATRIDYRLYSTCGLVLLDVPDERCLVRSSASFAWRPDLARYEPLVREEGSVTGTVLPGGRLGEDPVERAVEVEVQRARGLHPPSAFYVVGDGLSGWVAARDLDLADPFHAVGVRGSADEIARHAWVRW